MALATWVFGHEAAAVVDPDPELVQPRPCRRELLHEPRLIAGGPVAESGCDRGEAVGVLVAGLQEDVGPADLVLREHFPRRRTASATDAMIDFRPVSRSR